MATSPPSWEKYKTLFSSILPQYKQAHYIAEHIIHTSWDAIPNVLLYAPKGFPLQLLINYIMTQRFGPTSRTLHHLENHNVPFIETPNTFELDLLHPNIKSLDIVSEFVHTIISRANIIPDQRHIFILHNIDALYEERFAYRVLLERFCKNVMFLCTTTRISAIESPLRSRFITWTIPALTTTEIAETMKQLDREVHPLLQHSRNLFQVMLIADMDPNSVTPALCTLRYPPIADFFKTKWTIETLRTLAFKLCSYNITFQEVANDLLCLFPKQAAAHAFIQSAAEIEHAYICTNGGRKPLYYEQILHAALAATCSKK
jgi:hypothetical protein